MGMFRRLPPPGPVVRLAEGDLELVVMPACGARIVSLRQAGRDILRPASAEALGNGFIYGFAGFPLMPYSGPIFGGGFAYCGQFYRLARNVPAEPSATHGEAWISPWRVESCTENRVELAFEYEPSDHAFPFRWHGRIAYRLEGAALSIDMTLANAGRARMPAGMGMHPYFPKAPGATLTFRHGAIWPPDAPEAVRQGAVTASPGLDFNGGQPVIGRGLDRCFDDWDGVATLSVPDGFTTTIEADPVFGKLQLYDAWDYPYICIEPVTNANDGFNRMAHGVPGHAVRELAPGEAMQGSIRITAAFPPTRTEQTEETRT